MRRLVTTLIASLALLGAAGCGTTTPTVSPQERQQIQQWANEANQSLKAWDSCTQGPNWLEQYRQCMLDQGQSPDGP